MSDTATIHWTLGDRIAKARRVAGLEQIRLAEACDVSRALISQWENDRSEPRVTQLATIAELTGQPVSWLLTGDESAYLHRSDDELLAFAEAS